MKTLFHLIAGLTALPTVSCSTSQPNPPSQAVAPTATIPGTYLLTEVPGLKFQLVMHPNGTYDVTSQMHSAPQEKEQGIWNAQEHEVYLRPTNGQTSHPIRQLRPDPQKPGNLLWVVPGITGGQGALTYFSLEKQAR